jgi:putative ABC transport system permease protein
MKLAWRMLLRDWRAGELRILALALVIAVASVTSVGFFGDRVAKALLRDAHQLLGADVLLVADHQWKPDLRQAITRHGLALAETATFISMTRRADNAQLSGIKAVSAGFPLRGQLRIADGLNQPDRATHDVPSAGAVWVDERLAQALNLKVGDVAEVGNSRFTVQAILTLEPDRGPSFFNFAPRLLMRMEDLSATGLVTTGSRISYSLLAAGEPDAVAAFESWVKPQLGRGERIESLSNARPEVRNTLERGQNFVGLTALLAVVLAAVAVSLSTRRFSLRHQDGYAVMRCFGAGANRLLGLALGEFLLLGLAASALGCALGFAAQYAISALVSQLAGSHLPQPGPLPALRGFLIGLALLLGFALPPLLQLRHVPALRVLRRDVGLPRQAVLLAYGLGALVLAGLLMWQAGDLQLGLIVVGGFAGAFVVFAALSWAALILAGRAGRGRAGVTWRYGLANLRRHMRSNVVQALALALGLTAVLLLSFTRQDLLATWKSTVPPDAPNRFVINIQPEQRDALAGLFRAEGLAAPVQYPMIRGRITQVNGQPVNVEDYRDNARRMVEREFNLSYMRDLPPANTVVDGHWFSGAAGVKPAPELSVEEGIARNLGWKVGDRLTWQVAGQDFTAPITSIRKLEWDSMQVNFFVIASPGLFDAAPTSYITSFHLPESRAAFANTVATRFPNLTVIDLSAILKQAQSVIDQVVGAVQFVFLFAIAAGIVVLYAALLSTQDERQHEAALMRALGAARGQVLAAQRAEFAVLGAVAGLLAAAGATAIGYAVATQVLHFDYHVNPWVWLAGPLAGLACVAVNLAAGARAALNHPPLLVLREEA